MLWFKLIEGGLLYVFLIYILLDSLINFREMRYDGIVLESWSRWAAYGILHDPEMRNMVNATFCNALFSRLS